ncbi:TolA colicin import membrane protein (plasmid) [Legionella adelaidensis]|uniref:TolA colicin import membrane protein n=1 Tax=Legionella adelaidensis TaxID=45056 RepID=A0A0W0R1Y1_9GAMM|nr:cell envelope integrity protein TolA [Legionella adelaidensis]KTC65105.1 TolA colicin import membrane protein [Legionella adelaidensis]VEH85375.1 TolA colicin import membrane protein [Legionella adelaidensis]
MMQDRSYRTAFGIAFAFHIAIAILLLIDPSSQQPLVMQTAEKESSQALPLDVEPQEEPIKAVAVDNTEIMETVNRLKQEQIEKQHAEQKRQQALKQQAENARKQRLEEQNRVKKLKEEAAKLALAREKELAEEKARLEQITKQKKEEEKRLAEMKQKQEQLAKQQKEEAEKLEVLKKKKAEELAKAEKEKLEKEKLEKEKAAQLAREQAELEKKRQAALQQAAIDNERNARIAGEVDKYKALIISAISRQWILPENINSGVSSQFRIRLAPNGAVLEVNLTRSSGDPILDRSAQAAIYKASPLPVPKDPEMFDVFRDISLTVRPENARG